MSKITSNTLISIPILAMIVGGLLWMTDISATGKSNKIEIQDQKEVTKMIYDESKEIRKSLMEINGRLHRIEGRLEKSR